MQTSINKKFFLLLGVLPTFFPYVGFLPGFDVQPFFLIFIISALLINNNLRIKFEHASLFVFFVCYFLFFIALTFVVFDYRFFLTYLFAFLSLFLIHQFIMSNHNFIDERFILLVLGIYCFVAFMQLYIDPVFMASLVHRDEGAALTYLTSGRGARSLTGEPSHFGKLFSFINVLLIFIIFLKKDISLEIASRSALLYSFALLLLNGFLAGSVFAFVVHLSIVAVFILLVTKSFKFILIYIISTVFIIIIFLNFLSETRMVSIIQISLSNPELLLEQGAIRRLLNIPISINNLREFGFIGASGSLERFEIDLWTPFGSLLYEGHSRNIGGLIEIILKFGVFSLPFLILFSLFIYRTRRMPVSLRGGGVINLGPFYIYSFFILMVNDGPIALPIGWFVFLYAYSLYRRRHFIDSKSSSESLRHSANLI